MPKETSSSQSRRAQIVSLSMTELMLLLVFMAIAFSFLAKKEGLLAVPQMQLQLNELKRENAQLRKDLAASKAEEERLRRFLERINIDVASLKPKGGPIIIDGKPYVVGQAPGHPQCTLKGKYLLRLAFMPGLKIRGAASWDEQAEANRVSALPGIGQLSSGQALSLKEFSDAAESLFTKALATDNCVFVVTATRETKDADEFDAELRAVEKYFNVSRR